MTLGLPFALTPGLPLGLTPGLPLGLLSGFPLARTLVIPFCLSREPKARVTTGMPIAFPSFSMWQCVESHGKAC